MLLGGERGGNAGWAGTDDDQIIGVGASRDARPNHVFDSHATLLDAVFDEPHTAQFAGNVDTLHVGFVSVTDMREVNAPLFCTDDQRDGVYRTGMEAGTVAYAVGCIDEGATTFQNSQYIFFRTSLYAGTTFDAGIQIYKWVKRNRLV